MNLRLLLRHIFKRPFGKTIFYAVKLIAKVPEGETVKSRWVMRLGSWIDGGDRWFWKLLLIKHHPNEAARAAYAAMIRHEYFDYATDTYTIDGLKITREAIEEIRKDDK